MLHLSSDGGTTWRACESIRQIPGYDPWTFPPPPHIPHVRSIVADPLVPGAVYIGVEEGGVYRSDDEGETWASLNDGLDWDVHTVLPAAHPGRLYATTGVGFHRSDDAGRTWRHAMSGMDRAYTIPLAAPIGGRDRVLTAAAATPPPGWRANGTANAAIFASDDAGEQWTRVADGLPSRFDSMVRWMLNDEGRVFAISATDLYVSGDGGAHWDAVPAPATVITAAAVIPSLPA
ncbi:MAG: exo-alpha-sialidase [Chloroflexota bacterium]